MTSERRVPFDLDAYVHETRTASTCFICEIVAGRDERAHDVIHRDGSHIVFLNRYPPVRGYCLVAPTAHREHVVGDFSHEEYVAIQALVHRVGTAVSSVVPTERLYLLSLGSQQGNRHVHWHVVPCPPGTPYEHQQTALLDVEREGYLEMDRDEKAELAAAIAAAM